MNEVLIKKVIAYKLNMANSILELLPEKVSKEVTTLRKVILESLNENFQEKTSAKDSSTKSTEGINSVTIE